MTKVRIGSRAFGPVQLVAPQSARVDERRPDRASSGCLGDDMVHAPRSWCTYGQPPLFQSCAPGGERRPLQAPQRAVRGGGIAKRVRAVVAVALLLRLLLVRRAEGLSDPEVLAHLKGRAAWQVSMERGPAWRCG